ncbi:hypothetical protein [Eleftheria terrae]|uniref:hypothetical protein n=1 Tax=Eleftheria terrae TaxID=1597781 RepID=UPI00263B77A5|nr:hypothetical protein [Eleftheria terrae]WKB50563.1 hypothetical protein N7L95_00145 [Eleftheria terrae]
MMTLTDVSSCIPRLLLGTAFGGLTIRALIADDWPMAGLFGVLCVLMMVWLTYFPKIRRDQAENRRDVDAPEQGV